MLKRVIGSLRQAASHGAEKVANTKHFYSETYKFKGIF